MRRALALWRHCLFVCFIMNICMMSSILQAQEQIKASFEIQTQAPEIKEAQPFDFEFLLYPVGEKTINELKNIVRIGDFLKIFYVFDIKEVMFSPNNQDVFVVRGRAVAKSKIPEDYNAEISFESQKISVKLMTPSISDLEIKSDKITFLDLGFLQSPKSKLDWLIILIGVVCLYGFFEILRRLIPKIKEKRKRKQASLNWIEYFKKATTRDEYERLYKQRDVWIDLMGGKCPENLNFLKQLEDVQYKRDWTEDELKEVSAKGNKVRERFESYLSNEGKGIV